MTSDPFSVSALTKATVAEAIFEVIDTLEASRSCTVFLDAV